MPLTRRHMLQLLATLPAARWLHAAEPHRPLLIAINAEYGMPGSQAAQSIEAGARLAAAEINEKGGLLGGRPLAIEHRDDRGLPARAIDNLRELARLPDLVAVFCGRFSPVALELIPVANELQVPLLDPWAAADGIANNNSRPNYVFRLSMTDTWAIETILDHARRRGLNRLTALLPNTGWGRSCQAAIDRYRKQLPGMRVESTWYNWGDNNFAEQIFLARQQQSQGLLLVANESEGRYVLQALHAMPAPERLPVIAHWGFTAGDFNQATGGLASELDLVTVQTFAFRQPPDARQQAVLDAGKRLLGEDLSRLHAQVGFAHAYDFTHLLAKAIQLAGRAERPAIRQALERLGAHRGLVRDYTRPFSPDNHEALSRQQVFLARYRADGRLTPVAER